MNRRSSYRNRFVSPAFLVLVGLLFTSASFGQTKMMMSDGMGGETEVLLSELPVSSQYGPGAALSKSGGSKLTELKALTRGGVKPVRKFFCSSANAPVDKSGVIKAVGSLACGPGRDTSCFWKKSFIRVGFMNGNPEVKKAVMAIVSEWTTWANIGFIFIDDPAKVDGADIKLYFEEFGPHYSMLGIDSWLPQLRANKDEPTMALGFLEPPFTYEDGTFIENVQSTVLHEFGHALGLNHEHQNPVGGIQWNRDAVIRDLSGPPNNWNIQTIDRNIFRALEQNRVKATEYDPSSIMHYPFPASWTLNNVEVEENFELSETDRRFISEVYPRKKLVVDESQHFKLSPLYTGAKTCLSLAKTDAGFVPFLADCTEKSNAQLWKFTHVGNGDYRLTNLLAGPDLSLSDIGLEYYSTLGKSGDYSGQKWTVTGLDRYKRLSSVSNGITNSFTAPLESGKRVYSSRTAHWSNQLWEFIAVK